MSLQKWPSSCIAWATVRLSPLICATQFFSHSPRRPLPSKQFAAGDCAPLDRYQCFTHHCTGYTNLFCHRRPRSPHRPVLRINHSPTSIPCIRSRGARRTPRQDPLPPASQPRCRVVPPHHCRPLERVHRLPKARHYDQQGRRRELQAELWLHQSHDVVLVPHLSGAFPPRPTVLNLHSSRRVTDTRIYSERGMPRNRSICSQPALFRSRLQTSSSCFRKHQTYRAFMVSLLLSNYSRRLQRDFKSLSVSSWSCLVGALVQTSWATFSSRKLLLWWVIMGSVRPYLCTFHLGSQEMPVS